MYISFGYYSFLLLQEKLQFYHVKVSNKLLLRNVEITPDEGLGSLPRDLDSVSSLLLFNTSENPYVFYIFLHCGCSVILKLSSKSFIYQVMHNRVALKNIKIYIKTAPTCFGSIAIIHIGVHVVHCSE